MAVYEYAEAFTNLLQQKYAKEMCSDALTQSNPQVKFLNAQTIKLPRMTVSGYKDHAETAKLSDLETVNATIKQLDADTVKTASLSAEVAKLGYVTADTLDSQYARLDKANIVTGWIDSAMIGTGVVGTVQIADGSITDAKIVDLTANKITAGILSVERLEIRGSTGSIVYALNNITGALQAQNVDTLNGEILTERTITADKIVAQAITANEIAAGAITTNKLITGAVTADKLNVNDLSAISALIGGWELGTGYIRDLDANGHYTGIGRYGIAEAFFAGGTLEDGSDGVFRVGHDGSLYATDATISGNINAESLYVSEPVYTEVATIAGINDVMANYMQTITTNNPFGNDVAKGYSYFGMLVESEGLAGSGSVSDAGITIRTSEKRHDYGYLMADMTIYASGTLGLESDTEITINGKSFLDAIYPVGSIYMSVKSTNPGTLFGGTWVAWGSGRVPVGVNGSDTNFATVEKTGGASTVKLTAAQSGVPAHAHGLNGHTHAMATNPQGVMKYNNPGGQMTRTQVATSSSSKKYAFTASGTDYLIYGSGAATGGASGSAANNAAAPAASAHDNLQPYITCYMFKRTA